MFNRFLLLFILFAPTFPLFGRAGYGLLTLITFFILILRCICYRNEIKFSSNFLVLFVYFSIFTLLTTISVLKDVDAGFFNLSFFYQIIFFPTVFLIMLSLTSINSTVEVEKYIKWFLVLSFIMALYALLEVYWEQFLYVSSFLYKKDRLIIRDKATGTFGVTYFFAYFMLLSCFHSFIYFMMSRRCRHLILFLFFVFIVLITQSRTIFICIVAFFLLLMFHPTTLKNNMMKNVWSTVAFITFALFVIMYVYHDEIFEMFNYIVSGLTILYQNGIDFEGANDSSHNIRINQIIMAYKSISGFPLIGAGIGSEENVMLESIYAMYIYRYGIISLLFYTVLLLFFSYRSAKVSIFYKRTKNDFLASFFFALSLFYIISPIALFSSAMHDTIRLAVIFYGFGTFLFINFNNEINNKVA